MPPVDMQQWHEDRIVGLLLLDLYRVRTCRCLRMSYGRRNDNFGPKPVEAGKEYDVQITEISRKGDGIARIQGFVIFVKDGKVGQSAKIRVNQIGPRFATAELVDGSASASTTSESTTSESTTSASTSAPPTS